jgi:hypothetical protein
MCGIRTTAIQTPRFTSKSPKALMIPTFACKPEQSSLQQAYRLPISIEFSQRSLDREQMYGNLLLGAQTWEQPPY